MQHPTPPSTSSLAPADRYNVGTLTYTKMGLVALFGWLLWGDFCFQMMEAVTPAIIPLKLQHLDAPNWAIALIITTFPGMLNMTVCPWVSFKSDRHRGPRGRRIPYIMSTLPFLCVFLVLLGLSGRIGHSLHHLLPESWNITPNAAGVICVGFFMVGFQFFNMFVSSVFWYLFNDVVPHAFLGRFLGLFRIVAGIKGVLFNIYIFPHAESHMEEIFIGAAVIYAIGMGMMCFKVKEGEYPPPPPLVDGQTGFTAQLKTFFVECYSQPFY